MLKQFIVGDVSKRKQIEKEIRVLSKLRHPLIVQLQAAFIVPDGGDSYLQLPFIEHGTLRDWMKEERNANDVQMVTRQVSSWRP